jgi:hypothetical protein
MGKDPADNGAWMETYSGKRVPLQSPEPEDIDLQDIASALSTLNRFTGHTLFPYSVAQHCVLMTKWARKHLELSDRSLKTVLLHDAAEAYLGDVASPLKHILPTYKALEQNFERVIKEAFSLKGGRHIADVTRTLDLRMLATERAQLMPNTGGHEWNMPDWAVPFDGMAIEPWSSKFARAEFIDLYNDLPY